MNFAQLRDLAASAGLSTAAGSGPGGTGASAAEVAAAVAMAESGGNPRSHNTKPPDNSYGLWQINMYGNLGPDRRARFGLASNDALFDPAVNAKAMASISSGGKTFGPWTTFTSGKYRGELTLGTGKYGKSIGLDEAANAATDPVGAAKAAADVLNPLSLTFDGLKAIGAFFAALLQWSTWLRVLQILGGLVLLAGGVAILSRDLIPTAAAVAAVA